jgi:hypothetical protein
VNNQPFWAIAYHTNSLSPRAVKWYRVSRLIEVDGATFELYWHANLELRGKNVAAIRANAKTTGIDLVPGTYRDTAPPRCGHTMERV